MALVMKEKIFTCTIDDTKVTIHFNTQYNKESLRVNEAEDYAPLLQLKEVANDRDVVVDGKVGNDAYAALGFYLVLFNARSVVYMNETGTHPTTCIYSRECLVAEPKQWFKFTPGTTSDLAEIVNGPLEKGYWDKETFEQLKTPALISGKQSSILTITGRGAQDMYAALGIAAALHGYEEIRVEKPRINYAVAFSKTLAGKLEPRLNGQHNGIVLGILGDPNSGKSVFSNNFFHCVKKSFPDGFETWVYDCDMASPTPNWYLDGMESEREAISQRVKEMREINKVKWDSEKEDKVTQDLVTMKTTLDLVIADMPGGKHPKDGEDFPPERIPKKRDNMMSKCDYYIVICRKDKPYVFDAWKEALQEHGLNNRIIARIITDTPDAEVYVSPLSKDDNGYFTCDLRGLDRSKPSGQIVDAMQNSLRELVEFLIQSAQQRKKTCP